MFGSRSGETVIKVMGFCCRLMLEVVEWWRMKGKWHASECELAGEGRERVAGRKDEREMSVDAGVGKGRARRRGGRRKSKGEGERGEGEERSREVMEREEVTRVVRRGEEGG